MKSALAAFLVASLFLESALPGQTPAKPAGAEKIELKFGARTPLKQVVDVYQQLSGRNVWVDLALDQRARNVHVPTDQRLSREAALAWLRDVLSEPQNGIILADSGEKEAYLSLSNDPDSRRVHEKPD